MKTLQWLLLLIVGIVPLLHAGDLRKKEMSFVLSLSALNPDTLDTPSEAAETPKVDFWENRRTTATLYSIIVPGSGQTMLGSTYKGVGFSIAAFGSVLTALISQNNFIASNERLDALEFQYKTATTWVGADAIYRSMLDTHGKMVQYKKQRDTFIIISAAIWTANIVDVLFNTEDEGDVLFSGVRVSNVLLADGTIENQPRITFTLSLK